MVRGKAEDCNPTKAATLAGWLFLKYGMRCEIFRKKSKARRDALREEFTRATGRTLREARKEFREADEMYDEAWRKHRAE